MGSEKMSVWSGIQSLARRFLGVEEPEVADLSKIDADLAPTAKPRPKNLRHALAEAEPIEAPTSIVVASSAIANFVFIVPDSLGFKMATYKHVPCQRES